MYVDAVVTILHLAVVLFIIVAGLMKANTANMTPFLLPDVGARGIFDGAALVSNRTSCKINTGDKRIGILY